mmetsp:Transcript_8964/g.17975  ORF Transcript_8964/g.17975 Transcript_8964/m.17975 type:complete len:270 (-) Transcript_8964:299-1108(-)|eukprot:CAMPEP_0182473652 /NCGR_PEP_ID=MMETSP1319-20130603/24297_1 /TAXON_ID=172717 /ORGANISM="Bolidomonas pacifica, Strain RCC208" /LENGTH=269 /DNA_ID=CAMNT_0024674475 /DNA_START=149 /DNA_END=958 /DNA_ORIENTATION=+
MSTKRKREKTEVPHDHTTSHPTLPTPKEVVNEEENKGEAGASGGYWFPNLEPLAVTGEMTSSQTSSLTNANLPDAKPAEYPPAPELMASTSLPFPTIYDTTEGVAAFLDIHFPKSTRLVVDIGAGRYDHVKNFLQAKYASQQLICLPTDPFHRTRAHNEAVRKQVEAAGGADVATSISVLNILSTSSLLTSHIKLLHRALRPGGTAYIKVWAGMWPERGTGEPTVDEERKTYQSNRWASEYRGDVQKVFGEGRVLVDAERHLIVAVKEV